MRRGEVWLVDLDPAVGSEADKRRPALIVSNDTNNAVAQRLGRGVVTVVPITSNVRRVHTFQVLLRAGTAGLTQDSKAQAEQVRAIDVTRLRTRLGALGAGELAVLDEALRMLDEALRAHLAL